MSDLSIQLKILEQAVARQALIEEPFAQQRKAKKEAILSAFEKLGGLAAPYQIQNETGLKRKTMDDLMKELVDEKMIKFLRYEAMHRGGMCKMFKLTEQS